MFKINYWLLIIYLFKIISDKICVVANNGGNDKTKDYCPALVIEKSSQVECIFANDK